MNADGDGDPPRAWRAVYDGALLNATSQLLRQYEDRAVAVPGDVQALVDAVYDESFSALGLKDAAAREQHEALHIERLAAEVVQKQLAAMVHVKAPQEVGADLHRLSETSAPVGEELITTRLGADSARVVCVHDRGGGRWTLDEDGEVPVPGWGKKEHLTRAETLRLVQYLIPVPGRWTRERDELRGAIPESWQKNAVTRDWLPLVMRREAGAGGASWPRGGCSTVRMGCGFA